MAVSLNFDVASKPRDLSKLNQTVDYKFLRKVTVGVLVFQGRTTNKDQTQQWISESTYNQQFG